MMGKENTMDKRGKFIVLDGMDGSGKGTQLKLLGERLKDKNFLFTREPGGSPRAELIRSLILDKDGPASNPICDFFLFWAARGSHVEDVVRPARETGTHVLCDRYDSSTYAFQVMGEGGPTTELLADLFREVRTRLAQHKYYLPDLYIVLDLPAEVAYERRKQDHEQKKSRFDLKPLEYHKNVRSGFQVFSELFDAKVVFVDADRPPEEVYADVSRAVLECLNS
jgi:dTMP kinase